MSSQKQFTLLLLGIGLSAGCAASSETPGQVVVYTALDREFSEPILEQYEAETAVRVAAKYDVESTKTVGLTNRLLSERDRPRCDLFWNNEILNTLRLRQAGLLAPFTPEFADEIPNQYKASDGTWYGFAGRARILIVNTDLLDEEQRPTSILDLTDPTWRGRIGIAKPLFGTTATHAACLFETWGSDDAEAYFDALRQNDVQVLSGNKQVAQDVASGRLAFGLTDTDDAMVMLEIEQAPVAIVYPDQGDGELGTLFIPNTIALIAGSPNPAQAKRLASALLHPDVETVLANGPSAQIPMIKTTSATARVETPQTIRPMSVDFEAAAVRWDEVASFLRESFATD